MEEMLIIPRAEAPELLAKHSALLMEDGRLAHAARLAAQRERLLTDPTLPDDVAVERVKPVGRKLRRAVKKLRQLQTQPLTAEEEVQEGQELLTPALSKWMRRMVRAASAPPPQAPPSVPAPPSAVRRLLPSVPHTQTPTGTKRKTPPILASQRRRHRLEETPKRIEPRKPSRLPIPTPTTAVKPSQIPVPSTQKKKSITPLDLSEVQLKPTPQTKKKSTPSPHHLKASITPEALQGQSTQLKKVGPPRTTQQTNPLMVSLAQEMDKRRRALDPEHQSTGELKGLAKEWKAWK